MSKIDQASPRELCDALLSAQPGKGYQRSNEGLKILLDLYRADDNRLPYDQADGGRNTLEAHFGWVCRRTAEQLGDQSPEPFALCNTYTDEHGIKWLALKPNVVEALKLAYSRPGKR
ncbi:MAG: hypothetical protein ACLFWF_12280 [Alphaproteobacteria bacterium]